MQTLRASIDVEAAERDPAPPAARDRPAPLAVVPPFSERARADGLYRRYGPAVYRRCLRLLRDREAARDATQEVFIKLLREIERLEDPDTALAWAYRVATNHCLNVARDARRRREDALDPKLEMGGGGPPTGYPELALARAVLSRFDAQTQAVAVGVFVDGMEHEEVATLLGISRRTVARKLDRFLEHARKYLARSE